MKTSSIKISIAYDVGHSSIGWAVMRHPKEEDPSFAGCGAVIFPADDCLASKRRVFRSQRRHIRATRMRISRMERLLLKMGVLKKNEIEAKHAAAGGHGAPWLLAARVLKSGNPLGSWAELWDVLRWYAHNRGYDGNKKWSASDADSDHEEDTKKVEAAKSLYQKYSTETMCETFCAVLGLDPQKNKISAAVAGNKRPKGLNAAFPRQNVENEVQRFLEAHKEKLPQCDDAFIKAVLSDWKAIPCETIFLPARYHGGLLFGQLVPRFDNRIISTCPITYERVYQESIRNGNTHLEAAHEAKKMAKVPSKNCIEFLRFRWAMQVANILVADSARISRPLTADERKKLNQCMVDAGSFTPTELKKAVRSMTGCTSDNLDQMLMHPDADEALLVSPSLKALKSTSWFSIFETLPEKLKSRAHILLMRGKALSPSDMLCGTAVDENEISRILDRENVRNTAGEDALTREKLLSQKVSAKQLPMGRAPYTRAVMKDVDEFVFSTNRHPTEGSPERKDNAPLYRSEAIRQRQVEREIDEQTNNHLVRHRLKILERLHKDVVKNFAADAPEAVGEITIEVNRDLKEFSGKTAKAIQQDIGLRLCNFKSVTKKLEDAFKGTGIRITPGLIRKARIAEDLGWKCPFTGQEFDAFALVHCAVDKDHIIPRSWRPSDSLDSLVITSPEVNKMKGQRTAIQFIEADGGKNVEGKPNLTIMPMAQYRAGVEALDQRDGHDDDKRRKKNRKKLLLLRDYVEKEFVPRDLTQTSHLVRLGAQILERFHFNQKNSPSSLPCLVV